MKYHHYTHIEATPALRLLIALLAILIVGCGKGTAPGGGMAQRPLEVTTVTMAPQRLALNVELPGRTSSYRIAEVRPQVNGIILKRFFTEGAEVKAGDQLYQIDQAPYQAAYDSAQAAVLRAQSTLELAKLSVTRQQKLASEKVTSQQDFDDAQAAYNEAAADLAARQADANTARINLDYTKITSPITGKIGRSQITEGALVSSLQITPLAVVTQLDPIYVDVTQPISALLKLKREVANGHLLSGEDGVAQVHLTLDDGSAYDLPGRLLFSEVQVDEGTGSVIIRAEFPNPRQLLLPGMFVRASMQEGVNEKALLVPQQGVTHNQKGEPTAMVVGADNKVEQRILETDRTVGDKWLVTSGLAPGDRVIVEGLQKIHPGSEVNPTEQTSPAADLAHAGEGSHD